MLHNGNLFGKSLQMGRKELLRLLVITYPSDQLHIIADKDNKISWFKEGVGGVC